MRIILVTLTLVLIALSLYITNPSKEFNSNPYIHGAAYTPYGINQNPIDSDPSLNQIYEDLKKLKDNGIYNIRTYSTTGNHYNIAEIADSLNMKVIIGVWISKDLERNQKEINNAISIVKKNKNIDGVLIGNEAILRKDVTVPQLQGYVSEFKKEVKRIKVSTAEPWSIWLANIDLAKNMDFIAVHILPFWENTQSTQNQSLKEFVLNTITELRTTFTLPIVVTEIGWPSNGRSTWTAVPSLLDQALIVRDIMPELSKIGIPSYVMEAFDQPWKYRIEGSVGPHWGIFDARRELKFPMSGPVYEYKSNNSYILTGITIAALILIGFNKLGANGFFIKLSVAFIVGIFSAGFLRHVSNLYFYTSDYFSYGIIITCIISMILLFYPTYYEAIKIENFNSKRFFPDRGSKEFVSIHIAIHAEPPEVVKKTLQSLSRLNYKDFEVIVLDNNTMDPSLWKPIELECKLLNQNLKKEVFKFYHYENVKGYKAGALNIAHTHTSPLATIIAVVDADYVVSPMWLEQSCGYFNHQNIALIQSPQDHRDGGEKQPWIRRSMLKEYESFFKIGMKVRNEDNAIIQHGTMCLIRRSAFESVGGWSTSTICEDTELGLRLQKAGFDTYYLSNSQGAGLMPSSFMAYAIQRYRWTYGGIRIACLHFKNLLKMPLNVQKHYWFGWSIWISEAIGLVFTAGAIVWSSLNILFPTFFNYPPLVAIIPLFLALLFKISLSFYLQKVIMKSNISESIGAVALSLALYPFTSLAVIHALIKPNMPFFRTPKTKNSDSLIQKVKSVKYPMTLTVILSLISGLIYYQGSFDVTSTMWALAVLMLAIPFLLAVIFQTLEFEAQDNIEFIDVVQNTQKISQENGLIVQRQSDNSMDVI